MSKNSKFSNQICLFEVLSTQYNSLSISEAEKIGETPITGWEIK
jgi:hypothetical protein